jgi:hypothetical protein
MVARVSGRRDCICVELVESSRYTTEGDPSFAWTIVVPGCNLPGMRRHAMAETIAAIQGVACLAGRAPMGALLSTAFVLSTPRKPDRFPWRLASWEWRCVYVMKMCMDQTLRVSLINTG